MLDTLKGSRVISTTKGHGSFLTIDLDCNDLMVVSKRVSLWIYLCNWRLERNGKSIVNATNVTAESDFEFMVGKVFEKYVFSQATNMFEFYFSDGICIFIEPDLLNYEIDDDLMMLTFADGKTFGYSPGQGWQC